MMQERKSSVDKAIRAAWVTGLALVFYGPVAHSALPPLDDVPVQTERQTVSPLVLRAQNALSRLGLYLGVEDGRMNRATRAAIRLYQQSNDLHQTGEVTSSLVAQLEYAVGVRKLLHQLEEARAQSIKNARSKLMEHPATRDLVLDSENSDVADPTRDPSACFATPTAQCLLHEASESAKAIARQQMRDWALGEILIAEARAGLGEKAMKTAARIDDPRLVIVALRDIAEAQAAAGRPDAAVAAAMIIPDMGKRADALLAIADIQLRRSDLTAAADTSQKILAVLDDLDDPLTRIAFRAKAATVIAATGTKQDADQQLAIAEDDARSLPRDSTRSAALRHVASAFADMRETRRALDLLDGVSTPADKVPVLMSAATAQADAGDAASALATASGIENVRYRAVALGRIAVTQIRAGNFADADATLDLALAAVERIERPFARSFAVSKIALAMAERHASAPPSAVTSPVLTRAIDIAESIDDRRLRAHALWSIASYQRVAGDNDWAATEAKARASTEEIVGALSQVWLFADFAEEQADKGQPDAAWRAFDNGMEIAATIDNAWSRARTLARLAATLIYLVDPGEGRSPTSP